MVDESPARKSWIDYLTDEDLAFVKRFVLASGSLKEMARIYNISYPTVRLRLDRLIAKINVVEDHQVTSPFERLARVQLADGKIDVETFKTLMAAHRRALEEHHALEAPRRAEPDRSAAHHDGGG